MNQPETGRKEKGDRSSPKFVNASDYLSAKTRSRRRKCHLIQEIQESTLSTTFFHINKNWILLRDMNESLFEALAMWNQNLPDLVSARSDALIGQ